MIYIPPTYYTSYYLGQASTYDHRVWRTGLSICLAKYVPGLGGEKHVQLQYPRAIPDRIISSGSIYYNITRNIKDASL